MPRLALLFGFLVGLYGCAAPADPARCARIQASLATLEAHGDDLSLDEARQRRIALYRDLATIYCPTPTE